MAIHNRVATGSPSEVINQLRKFVGNQAKNSEKCKIGITNEPERRFKEAYKEEYDDMFVFYETQSHENAKTIERAMIQENWAESDNSIAGGGGRVGPPPYYVYIVVKRQEFKANVTGAMVGGAIFGGSIGGPVGAIIGGFLGAIIGDSVNQK